MSALSPNADGLRRRRAVNRLMEVIATAAAFAAVAVLGIMVVSVAKRGGAAIDWNLFTKTPHPFSFTNEPSGLAKRQRSKERGIDNTEHRCVGPQPEGQNYDSDRCESRLMPQLAKSEK